MRGLGVWRRGLGSPLGQWAIREGSGNRRGMSLQQERNINRKAALPSAERLCRCRLVRSGHPSGQRCAGPAGHCRTLDAARPLRGHQRRASRAVSRGTGPAPPPPAESNFLSVQWHADFDNYRISQATDRWAHAPPGIGRIVLSELALDNLTAEQLAVLMIHELYHIDHWTPGMVEENEAWELSAHVWIELGIPRTGSYWAYIEEESEAPGFPIPPP